MSAQLIVEYGGCPVRFTTEVGEWLRTDLVTEREATMFSSHADVWYAVRHGNLNPKRCRVVDMYARNQMDGGAKPGAHGVTRPTDLVGDRDPTDLAGCPGGIQGENTAALCRDAATQNFSGAHGVTRPTNPR